MGDAIERLAEAVKKAGWSMQLLAIAVSRPEDRSVDRLLDEAGEDAESAMAAVEEAIAHIRSLRAQQQSAQAS